MNTELEDMQFLGLFGIYREAFKLILTCRKIFTQITLSFILPLSFIFLAHAEISHLLLRSASSPGYRSLSGLVASEFIKFFLFKAAYLTVFLVLSLLSTAATVYAVACIYTSRDLALATILAIVPKVWKRLMATFLCVFAAIFLYALAAAALFVMWILLLGPGKLGGVVLIVFVITSAIGFIYLTVVFQLANVVSVLEDVYGFQAMAKSWGLITGKTWVAVAVLLKLNFVSFGIVQVGFQRLVVRGESVGMVSRVGFAAVFMLLLSMLFLFGYVIQTVLYFMCKSYHHESIDKSALSDRLEVYQGEYAPLKEKDVQLEHYYV